MRMAHVVRPLCSCFRSLSRHRIMNSRGCALAARPDLQQQKKKHLPYSTSSSSSSSTNFQSRGLRLLPSDDVQESSSDSETLDNKSRNQKKREARRAVQWGMELSTLSIPQIKRILRAASLDQEVFNALMLVKRFAPDVREGKRRQFNYIGRLLREVQPELMDDLIQASKDGDQSRLQELCAARESITEVDKEGDKETEFEEEDEGNILAVTSRWCAGLIDKDPDVTNEVYSIYTIEFNRQELRKLVRRVQYIQCRHLTEENKTESEAALAGAKKSLISFLRSLAKQMEQKLDY